MQLPSRRPQKLLLVLVLGFILGPLCGPGSGTAQAQEVVVTGTVTDSTTGAPISRATIQVRDGFRGTASDEDGEYTLTVDRRTVELIVQAVGYGAIRRSVTGTLGDTLKVDIGLSPEVYQLGTVTVEAHQEANIPSTYRLSAASLKNAPALGEADVIRVAARLPGVNQPNDMKSALTVRGGAGDQNKFLIDGIEVHNPNHLFGLFGPFHALALEDVTVHAAQFPARYGGRLSSVVAMQTRRPVDSTFVRANVGLVSAGGVGARNFGDTGVTLAARRTYADPVLAAAGSGVWYNFHDLNLKVTHDLGKGVALDVLGFLSRDALSPRTRESAGGPDLDVTWGGRMGALRLRHESSTYRHRLTGSYVRSYVDAAGDNKTSAFYDNQYRTLTAAYRGTSTLDRTRLTGGAEMKHQRTRYSWQEGGDFPVREVLYGEAPPAFRSGPEVRTLITGYASAEQHVGTAWSVQAGLRYSTVGWFAGGHFAPRLRLSYDVSDQLSLTAASGRYLQYVADGAEGREVTIDEPTFLVDEPQRAWTTTVGWNWRPAPNLKIGGESYYRRFRRMRRLARSSAVPYPTFLQASGTAYGLDLFARKRSGWLTGQLSYSYVRTRFTVEGENYPPDWSTPHTVKGLIGIWIGAHWQVRVAGTWRSGLPFTPATGSFRSPVFDPDELRERFIEGAKNSARLPAYTRLDLSLRRTYVAQHFKWTLYVQALNVLNRANALRVETRELYTTQGKGTYTPGIEDSLPFVPSFGVEFQF